MVEGIPMIRKRASSFSGRNQFSDALSTELAAAYFDEEGVDDIDTVKSFILQIYKIILEYQ